MTSCGTVQSLIEDRLFSVACVLKTVALNEILSPRFMVDALRERRSSSPVKEPLNADEVFAVVVVLCAAGFSATYVPTVAEIIITTVTVATASVLRARLKRADLWLISLIHRWQKKKNTARIFDARV